MKKITSATTKLKLGKNLIAKLNSETNEKIKGGLPRRSAAARQCCETDQFTACASYPGICW